MVRLPWRLRHGLDNLNNIYFYFRNRLYNALLPVRSKPRIIFNCGFHGKTGGVFAIASIANMLAKKFRVQFVSFPTSNYNPLLATSVKVLKKIDFNADLYICDVTSNHEVLLTLKQHNKPVIVSCHGYLDRSHGLTPDRVKKSLELANKVHFVSILQQESFQLEKNHFFIIPNTNTKIQKTIVTNNIGIVGRLDDENKNVTGGLELALKTDAEKVHLWGEENQSIDNQRVITHGWEKDKNKIYNSFDVLISLSKFETFGLVVAEALSGGIPCLLSDIPAFRQFKECPGVSIISSVDQKAVDELNRLLETKNKLKLQIIKFWEKNFSEEVIADKWVHIIEDIFVQNKRSSFTR